MKVIVKIKFKDKYSKVWHHVNDELSVTSKRYEEIKKFVNVLENDSDTKDKRSKCKK